MFHIEGAQELGTIAAHVPYGIGQKYHTGKRIDTSDAEKKWTYLMIIKCKHLIYLGTSVYYIWSIQQLKYRSLLIIIMSREVKHMHESLCKV